MPMLCVAALDRVFGVCEAYVRVLGQCLLYRLYLRQTPVVAEGVLGRADEKGALAVGRAG